MIHTLNIPITITSEQCHNVIETASGSIGYWECTFRNPTSVLHDGEKYKTLSSFEVHCVDSEPTHPIPGSGQLRPDNMKDEQLYPWALIDEACVLRGIELIVGNKLSISPSIRAAIIELLGEQDDGISLCDGEQADCIVQAGLFGELVYG